MIFIVCRQYLLAPIGLVRNTGNRPSIAIRDKPGHTTAGLEMYDKNNLLEAWHTHTPFVRGTFYGPPHPHTGLTSLVIGRYLYVVT